MRVIRVGMIVGLLLLGAAALALPSFLVTFKSACKSPKDSALDKAGCQACHMLKSGGKLNPFGEDVKKALTAAKATKLTADILKKTEALDSDKDGVKNADEIKAGTLPGDAKSVPAKK